MFLLILFLLPFLAHSQNIVLNVTGKALVNGKPVKKGDNLSNDAKIVFDDPATELKVLSQSGICVIKYKNYEQKNTSELMDLIKSCIRKNSVATLGTRAWTVNPDKDMQVALVDSLCKTLNVTPDNVDEMYSQYITPYCVLEFETPYWQDIAQLMQAKYGFKPVRLTGESMSEEQYEKIRLVPSVRSLAPVPSSASLKKYCPIPGNQGRYCTCAGWASAYGARTISWAVKNNLTDVNDITNQAFSPSFVYSGIKSNDDTDCQLGSSICLGVEVLKDKGSVFKTELPYQCDPVINPSIIQQAKDYAIKDFQRLTFRMGITTTEDFDNIKKALADKRPVLASIKCYQSFMDARGVKVWNGVPDSDMGYHAICLIGYDDNYNNGDGTQGAVELINSWGTDWGDGGFIHIKYQDFQKILATTFSLYDDARPIPPPEPPKPEPKPLPAPDLRKRMEGSFRLILSDGTSMKIKGDEGIFSNLKLASSQRMTYNIRNSYPGGTLFRIYFTSSQSAYVYVISTDSRRSPLAQLFPDPYRNVSALLDFKSEVSVSIPDETQYIQMDKTPGDDYLCVIYSKEELNINAIKRSLRNNPDKDFVDIVNDVLADKIVDKSEVTFETDRIAFRTVSTRHTAVPIFIKIKHT